MPKMQKILSKKKSCEKKLSFGGGVKFPPSGSVQIYWQVGWLGPDPLVGDGVGNLQPVFVMPPTQNQG